MRLHDQPRAVVSAQLMVQFAREHGMPLERCLANTGIAPATLEDSTAEIRTEQELQLTRNLVNALKHVPALGLEAGLRYSLASFGIWGFAILSSRTLRDALDVALRYWSLSFAFHRTSLREAPEEIRLVFDDSDIPADLRAFCMERAMASAARLRRDLTGVPVPMAGLRLRMARPAYAARFAEVCGVIPEFGAVDNSYTVDRARLDLPVAFGNPLVAQQVEKDCKALLERRRQRKGLAERVRDVILHDPKRIPALDAVAARLNMTPRTLRRHLVTESTSYRELVEEVRQTLAEELLTNGRLKMEEVAERLGYADATSFSHAFRRWKGHAPRDLR